MKSRQVNGSRMERSPHQHALWEWGIIVALLLVAFWFRTWRLADVPPGLHHDDIKNVLLVEKIMAGYVRIYYPENNGDEPLYHWLQAIYFALVGSGYPEVRLLSVGISMAGLATIYALVRRLLGRSVALWTLAWHAVSLWSFFYSRRAVRPVLLLPLAALTGYLFVACLDGKPRPKWLEKWRGWVLGGVSLAACLYVYQPSRVVPFFFSFFVCYLALVDRQRLQSHWRGIVLFFVVALALFSPLGAYLLTHTEDRVSQVNQPLVALREGDWRPMWENGLRALGMFTFIGDPHWRQFVADTPVFEPLGAVLFYVGVLWSLWRWRRLEYAFSLLWLPLMLSPAIITAGAPNFLRPIAVQATVYVFPALATVAWGDWLDRRFDRRWRWAAVGGTVAILAFNAWRTYDGYFVRWSRHPDVRFAYNATLIEEGQYLNAAPELVEADSVVLSGHFPADLDPALVGSALRRTDLIPRWCDIRQSLIFPGGKSAYLIQPDYFPIDPMLFDLFIGAPAPLYERRLAEGTFVFAVYPLDDRLLTLRLPSVQANPVGWSRALVFPDGLPGDWVSLSWPVAFGRWVNFIGYEVLNEEPASPGDVVTLLTYWQAIEPGVPEAITFAHLLNPEGVVVSGHDGFGAPPNRWIGGDVIVQLHRLSLPSDLAPGDHVIELGWYERDTGVRWPITLSDESQIDRLLLQPLTIMVGGGDR
jgi:4-amino-4-deoxy-L-arabinose transferase-like glycosyltransferase